MVCSFVPLNNCQGEIFIILTNRLILSIVYSLICSFTLSATPIDPQAQTAVTVLATFTVKVQVCRKKIRLSQNIDWGPLTIFWLELTVTHGRSWLQMAIASPNYQLRSPINTISCHALYFIHMTQASRIRQIYPIRD